MLQVFSGRPKILEELRTVLRPSAVVPTIISSVILWIVTLVIAVSCAALIFTGELSEYVGVGIAAAVISGIVINVVVALFGSDHATVGAPQGAPVLIQASLVGSFIASAPPDMSDEQIFLTAVSIIVMSAFLTGIILLVLSVGRAGSLIRFIPYPVMGGFLAGSGFMLVQDSFVVMAEIPFYRTTFPALMSPEVIWKWLPGMGYGAVLMWVLRRTGNFVLLPTGIVAGVALFYLALFLGNVNVEAAIADGWFMSKVDASSAGAAGYSYLGLIDALPLIDIPFVIAHAGAIASLSVIVLLNVLINLSGQEIIVGREINLNRELATSACGNMIASVVGGGIISFPCLACAALVHQARAYGRLVNLLICVLLGVTLLQGAEAIVYFPRMIIGGLLAFIGLDFLATWLYDTWGKLSRHDYAIIIIMLMIIAYAGFIAGMVSGVLLSVVLFVVEYARIGSVRQDFTGDEYDGAGGALGKSDILKKLDQQVWILRMQGVLFFGTSHQFYRRVRSRLENAGPDGTGLKYIILDFQLVKGIDISTVMDFSKVRKMAHNHDIRVLLSNVPPHVRRVLIDSSFALNDELDADDTFDDLDHAMQYCEHELLTQHKMETIADAPISQYLDEYLAQHNFDFHDLLPWLDRMDVAEDEMIAAQGGPSDTMFFIESGRISISLQDGENSVHLRSMSAGTVIGEMGFYLNQPRSANIVASQDSVLYSLSKGSLKAMETQAPAVAAAFHSFTSAILSERLTATNRMIQALTG